MTANDLCQAHAHVIIVSLLSKYTYPSSKKTSVQTVGGKSCMDEATNNFADLHSTTLPTNLIASINPKMWSRNIQLASFRLACYTAKIDSNGLLTLDQLSGRLVAMEL